MGDLFIRFVGRAVNFIIRVLTSSGVISGVISSLFLYFVIFRIKPKVKVSKHICRGIHDGIFRIKVVNLTRTNLTDVKYNLYACYRAADGNMDTEEIPPCKPKLGFIQAYSRKQNEKNTDFAIRISYKLNKYMTPDYSSFLFTFSAKHAVSGTSIFIRKEYAKEDVECGQFNLGESTAVQLPPCHNSVYQNCNGECAYR